MFSEDPILLPEMVDQIVLVTVHPASEREDEELQRRQHSLRLLGRLDQHRPSLGRFFAPYGVFVLYEDLRIEYLGATVPVPIEAIEDIGKSYRRNYFIRRSLVSLIEFSGALSRLNAIREWKEHIEQKNDDIAKRWKAAIKYFNDNHRRWETLRGDIGGHFSESTAMFALKNLSGDATGELNIRQFHQRKQGGVLFPFANEFVAIGMRKTMKVENGEEPTEVPKFFSELFEAITDGWEHAVGAANIVAKQYLEPRFITEEHRTRLGLS